MVGRETGRLRLAMADHADGETLSAMVSESAAPGAAVNTDGWRGYGRLARLGFDHRTVRHADREWARDGDGVREVHDNTPEGIWTGLRNFLRPFRGVSKWYLHQYVAMFEWSYNVKRVCPEFIQALLNTWTTTNQPA